MVMLIMLSPGCPMHFALHEQAPALVGLWHNVNHALALILHPIHNANKASTDPWFAATNYTIPDRFPPMARYSAAIPLPHSPKGSPACYVKPAKPPFAVLCSGLEQEQQPTTVPYACHVSETATCPELHNTNPVPYQKRTNDLTTEGQRVNYPRERPAFRRAAHGLARE